MRNAISSIIIRSHNAGVNYANRNATQHTPTSKFAIGYLSAVTVSVSIAVNPLLFSFGRYMKRLLVGWFNDDYSSRKSSSTKVEDHR